MNYRQILLVSVGMGSLASVLVAVTAFACQIWLPQYNDQLKKLDQSCTRTLANDGFGHVTVGSLNLAHRAGQLRTPCVVTLKSGSIIRMAHVRLQSKNLFIQNELTATKPITLILDHVYFSGTQAGLQVTLKASGSRVLLRSSLIDYARSVGISVGSGDSDSQAHIQVTSNTIKSNDKQSEGVVLTSTGQAQFVGNRFVLASPQDTALLLGSHCVVGHNIAANDHCPGL